MLTTNIHTTITGPVARSGKRRAAVGVGTLALAAAGLVAAPSASRAATIVIGTHPGNQSVCAALGGAINGLETGSQNAEAAGNSSAAAGLQQAADSVKLVAQGQGCVVLKV